VEIGYRAVPAVEDLGEFSLHGGILDIFSTGEDTPVRIELFGDTVESIRGFDPASQRSADEVDRVLILPTDLEAIQDQDDETSRESTTIFHYLPEGALAILDEPMQLTRVKIKSDEAHSVPDHSCRAPTGKERTVVGPDRFCSPAGPA
jgi:transcription-repair coupling factor (superfamily II helicase)